MIPCPPAWTVSALDHGFGFVATHPEGPRVATLYYRDRVRPVRAVDDLVEDILCQWPAVVATRYGTTERLVTLEGEHAAAVNLHGRERDRPVQITLGFVLTDDHVASVAGICREAGREVEVAALVRELVRADVQALGIRRRRFEYEPPPGFDPLGRGQTVEWLAPEYPRDGTALLAHPATPRNLVSLDHDAIVSDLLAAGATIARVDPVFDLHAQHVLSGTGREIELRLGDGRPLRAMSILLEDSTYQYPLVLVANATACWDDRMAMLYAVARSIQPVPAPTRAARAAESVALFPD